MYHILTLYIFKTKVLRYISGKIREKLFDRNTENNRFWSYICYLFTLKLGLSTTS